MKMLVPRLCALVLFLCIANGATSDVMIDDLKYNLSESTFINPKIKSMGIKKYLVFPADNYTDWVQKEPTTKQSYAVRNADKVEMVMMRLGFDCVERSKIDKIVNELKLGMTGLTEDNAKKIGKLANADAIVLITITDMGLYRYNSTSISDITVKAVSITTGAIIWKSMLKGSTKHNDDKIATRVVCDWIETKLYGVLENKLKDQL